MGELIEDDVLNAFSIVAEPKDVGGVVRREAQRRHKSLQPFTRLRAGDDVRHAIVRRASLVDDETRRVTIVSRVRSSVFT